MSDTENPFLSVVVVVVSDTIDRRADASLLAGALEALENQADAPPLEVIVPHHELTAGIEAVRRRFPSVRFLEVRGLESVHRKGSSREHHDELRARGIAAARGDIIALIEDHGRPDPDWSRRMVEAHRSRHAAVGGPMENAIDRAINWAVYFCDFGRYQNPLPAGETWNVSDANVSYKRSALDAVSGTWASGFREPEVNAAIGKRGLSIFMEPGAVVSQNRGQLRLGDALRERFVWGRSYAAGRAVSLRASRRAAYAILAPILPAVLILRMTASVVRKRRLLPQFGKSLPVTALLTIGWAAGEAAGYLRPGGQRTSPL